MRPALGEHDARRLEHRGDGGLVVGAEDRGVRVADDAVLDHRLDRPLRQARCRGGRRGRAASPRRSARGGRRGCPSSRRRASPRRPRRRRARGRAGSAATRSATARSSPGGLGIAASSTNRSTTSAHGGILRGKMHRTWTRRSSCRQVCWARRSTVRPCCVFVADENRRYVAVNDYACRLLGYTREELLELTVDQIARYGEAPGEYAEMVARRRPRGRLHAHAQGRDDASRSGTARASSRSRDGAVRVGRLARSGLS